MQCSLSNFQIISFGCHFTYSLSLSLLPIMSIYHYYFWYLSYHLLDATYILLCQRLREFFFKAIESILDYIIEDVTKITKFRLVFSRWQQEILTWISFFLDQSESFAYSWVHLMVKRVEFSEISRFWREFRRRLINLLLISDYLLNRFFNRLGILFCILINAAENVKKWCNQEVRHKLELDRD